MPKMRKSEMKNTDNPKNVMIKELLSPDMEKIILFFVLLATINYIALQPCTSKPIELGATCAINYTLAFIFFAVCTYIPACAAVHLTKRKR
jgi:hypothetical protein